MAEELGGPRVQDDADGDEGPQVHVGNHAQHREVVRHPAGDRSSAGRQGRRRGRRRRSRASTAAATKARGGRSRRRQIVQVPRALQIAGPGSRRTRGRSAARPGTASTISSQRSRSSSRRRRLVHRLQSVAARQQDVSRDERKRSPRPLVGRAGPVVMDVERGAVVDQPGAALPDQQVRVAVGPIGIGHQSVEPDQPRGELRGDQVGRGGASKLKAPSR